MRTIVAVLLKWFINITISKGYMYYRNNFLPVFNAIRSNIANWHNTCKYHSHSRFWNSISSRQHLRNDIMSGDLFYTQLVAQQYSSGKDLTSAADGAASKSVRHSQSHDELENNDQGFLKTLERFSDNQQPFQKSKPSGGDKMPVAENGRSDSGSNNDISDRRGHKCNMIGANSHIPAENNVVAIGQHIDLANINLLDLLKQLGIEILQTDGNGRIDEPAAQGENTKSGVALEHGTAVSTQLPSIDLAKLDQPRRAWLLFSVNIETP